MLFERKLQLPPQSFSIITLEKGEHKFAQIEHKIFSPKFEMGGGAISHYLLQEIIDRVQSTMFMYTDLIKYFREKALKVY